MPRAFDHTVPVDSEGMLSRSFRQVVAGYLKLYAGGDVRVRFSKPIRSTKANSYYWGVVLEDVRMGMVDAGYVRPAIWWHKEFKGRYLPMVTDVTFSGKETTHEPTTTKMDSTAFFEYVEAIKMDEEVLRAGIYIREPEGPFRSHNITEPT